MPKILCVFHSRYVDDDDGDVYGNIGEDGDTETTWKSLSQFFCISHTILKVYLTSYAQQPSVTPSLPTQGQSSSLENTFQTSSINLEGQFHMKENRTDFIGLRK